MHSVLEPYFDAVRDTFAAFEVAPGQPLDRLRKVTFMVTEAARSSSRHFAATHTNGRHMLLAPELAELPFENLVAILCHEFGHAADFSYPASWTWPDVEAGSVVWVGEKLAARATAWREHRGHRSARSRTAADDGAPAANWTRAWESRTDDQIEWAADGITEVVTGKRPRYCGPCKIQCFSPEGIERPAGLR